MTPKFVNQGVYDAREVAFLLGKVRVETVVRWSAPTPGGLPAVVAPSLQTAFSFVDLVSLSVAATIHSRQISDRHLRLGVQQLARRTQHSRPLSWRATVARLGTSGLSFLFNEDGDWIDLGTGGQGTFKDIVSVDLRSVDFDAEGVAAKWPPTLHIVQGRRVQAGAPVIEGTRIPTATIADLAEDGSLDEIAEEYDLPLAKVKAAVRFEKALRSGAGMAA